MVTGDQWLNEEVRTHSPHARNNWTNRYSSFSEAPEYPLVRRQQETEFLEQQYGSVPWVGAWTPRFFHPSDQLGEMPEGKPTIKAQDEDAAHFLVRIVRKYPHQVTIYEGGPMTNLALAIAIDPEFAALAKELVFMGASLNPRTDDPEFVNAPTHEFNIWFDPEAAHAVYHAPWKRIVCTPVDISVKTRLTSDLINRIKTTDSPVARYIGKYARLRGNYNYLWDELAAAAWLDPSLITKKEARFLDVDLDRGANYGNTLSSTEHDRPKAFGQSVEVQEDLDLDKFYRMFVDLLSAPTRKN